jgi:mono/diheme cytochrome c family protein
MSQSKRPRIWIAAILLGIIALLALQPSVRDFFRGYARADADALKAYDLPALSVEQRGAVYFALSDFGALDTDALESHATPWRLAGTALALAEADATGLAATPATLRKMMERFGFLYPESVANWPAGIATPAFAQAPLGVTLGTARRTVPALELTIANIGCAACHAGAAYNSEGLADRKTAWLGAPNTSLNLEAYINAIYAAFKAYAGDEARLLASVRDVFPDTSDLEMQTLKRFVWPRVRARLAKIALAGDRPLPFVNGYPGLTNGVAALKMQFHVLGDDAASAERGFTAIPDLADRGLRTNLLYDGAYALPEGADRAMTRGEVTPAHLDHLADITAFFTVPSMGVKPGRALDYRAQARDVFQFLGQYRAPPFPIELDPKRIKRGAAIYARSCANCHGAYDLSARPVLQSLPNALHAFSTDPARHDVFTRDLAARVEASAYGALVDARQTKQYAAPILTGLWMSAPYFHNGSVPSLVALVGLAPRPAQFGIGAHRLDLASVGVIGGDSVLDTNLPGLSNLGHTAPFDTLQDNEKRDLLEFLKAL